MEDVFGRMGRMQEGTSSYKGAIPKAASTPHLNHLSHQGSGHMVHLPCCERHRPDSKKLLVATSFV